MSRARLGGGAMLGWVVVLCLAEWWCRSLDGWWCKTKLNGGALWRRGQQPAAGWLFCDIYLLFHLAGVTLCPNAFII